MITFLTIYLLVIGLFLCIVENAKEGYQDSSGFHYGKTPGNTTRKNNS